MGKKTIKKHRNLVIEHDCRLVKQKNIFWVIIPIPVEIIEKIPPINYCGIDPGVKTFMTSFCKTLSLCLCSIQPLFPKLVIMNAFYKNWIKV